MFGRAAAERAVGRILDNASRSHVGFLRLVGEPGFGKTVLCQSTLEKAAKEGFLTVSCVGMEWESQYAMATMSQLLRPLVQECDALTPATYTLARDLIDARPLKTTDPYAVATAALATVAAAAEKQPLLLVIDDAHWVDPASAAVVSFVARRLYADAVALMISERTTTSSRFPIDWPTHVLEPLSAADIGELLAAERPELPHAAKDVCQRLRIRSGGNPLVLHELAPMLTARQLAGFDALPDPLPLGERGKMSFADRITNMPLRTREVLGVVAAAGSQTMLVQPALIALGLDTDDLDRAVQDNIVTSGPGPHFTHPLRRSAAYQSIPEHTRRRIHRALAELNARVDTVRYAYHLDQAGAAPDIVAAAAEDAAAAVAARAGDGAAAGMWARAAELSAEPEARRRRALRAASAFLVAGEGDACSRWLAETLGPSRDGGLPGQHQQDDIAAEALLVKHEAAVWHTLTDADLTSLALDTDRLTRIDSRRAVIALGLLAGVHENRGNLDQAITVTNRALGLAGNLSDQDRFIATAWAAHVFTLANGSAQAESLSTLVGWDAALALAEAKPMALWTFAQTAEWQEDLQFADQLSRLAISELRRRGLISWLPYALSVDAEVQWRAGDWTRARASAAEAIDLADTAGQRSLIGFTFACAGLVAGLTGDYEESEQDLRRALDVAAETGLRPVELYARQGLGAFELARGRAQEATTHLERAHALAIAIGMGQPSVVPYYADLVEALTRSGRHHDAARVSQHLRRASERSGSRWAAAVELRCRAQLYPDDPSSESWLRESITRFSTEVPQPYERYRSALELGALLRRKRRLTEARRFLTDAASGFRQLGALDWAERCDVECRAAGAKLRAPSVAAPGSLAQLTAQQLQVVLTVAGGATNREAAAALFLSPKTVDYHLRRACATLGVHSRVQLARLVASATTAGTKSAN